MVDLVLCARLMRVVLGVAEALAGKAGIVADEVCASHQQV